MKGKLGFYDVEPPEDIQYIWKTHVPTLSFITHEVETIYYHIDSKNFSIVLKPYNGKKVQRVICERHNGGYTVKNNIQFSERVACKRLSSHIGDIVTGSSRNTNVDIDVVNKNMEFLKEFYPEMVL